MSKKRSFKKNESYKHKYAVQQLAEWVGGVPEKVFDVEGRYLFVADVAVFTDSGSVKEIYEVVNTHPVDFKKLGMIQYWCYRNSTFVSVFEVSAEYILDLCEKPDYIRTMNFHEINPF